MLSLKVFSFVSLFLFEVSTLQAPFIKKCKDGDDQCITSSAQEAIPHFVAGLPQFGVNKLDKVSVKTIDASVGSLKLIVKDVTITGLETCKALHVSTKGPKLNVKLTCDIETKGQYTAGGLLTVVPIEGHGELRTKFSKLIINVDADLEESTGKDSKLYWKIKRYTPKFDFTGKSDIELDNLFDGNKVLADAVSTVLKSNGKEIATEVAPPFIQAAVKEIVKNLNKFFHAVPIEELKHI